MIDVIDLFNACLYIQDHLDADLSLVFLARTVGLSRFRFHRIFKAWRGETLHEFVTRMRMERAAFELSYPLPRSGKRSIKSIAFASGYKSLSSFSHAFSDYASLSPREFRNRALYARPARRRTHPNADSLGPFSIAVREEPAREIAVFDPVTRAGDAMGPEARKALRASAWKESELYGVELLPNLFVRSRYDRAMRGQSTPMSCVGVPIDAWRQAARGRKNGAPAYAPRTTIRLDGGRYAVVEGKASIASIYLAWRRSFDDWLALTGECPRPGRVYMRFSLGESGSQLTFVLHIPLEEKPAHGPVARRGYRRAAAREHFATNSSEPIGPPSRQTTDIPVAHATMPATGG